MTHCASSFCSFFSSAPASLAYAAWSASSAAVTGGGSAAVVGAVAVVIPGLAWGAGAGVAACVVDSAVVVVGRASQAVAARSAIKTGAGGMVEHFIFIDPFY
jgi:hypothetical protein